MPWQNLTGVHAIIILAVIILLFGAAKLPALAKSVGQSMKIFKNEIKSGRDDDVDQTPDAQPVRNTSAPGSTPSTSNDYPPKP
ncbi:twin-arginine translocase TatA/TatE family subunit [Marisediminicola sp. LYQ134]|uniref:twin-arginine translocase TatA/TatE family subunit n=1 Tax=unclassified Marisediminicola TaxID=2618316 RepID=UPI003983D9E9